MALLPPLWFRIMDPQGNVLLYTKMRAFKLREDIRVLGPDKQTEVVSMRARQILHPPGEFVWHGIHRQTREATPTTSIELASATSGPIRQ